MCIFLSVEGHYEHPRAARWHSIQSTCDARALRLFPECRPFSFNKLIDDKSLAVHAGRSVRASLSPGEGEGKEKGKKYMYTSFRRPIIFNPLVALTTVDASEKSAGYPEERRCGFFRKMERLASLLSHAAVIRVIPACGTRRNNKQLLAFNRPHAVPAYTANHWLPAEITRKLDDGRILPSSASDMLG